LEDASWIGNANKGGMATRRPVQGKSQSMSSHAPNALPRNFMFLLQKMAARQAATKHILAIFCAKVRTDRHISKHGELRQS